MTKRTETAINNMREAGFVNKAMSANDWDKVCRENDTTFQTIQKYTKMVRADRWEAMTLEECAEIMNEDTCWTGCDCNFSYKVRDNKIFCVYEEYRWEE